MFELTHKEGWKTLARMVEKADGSTAWYEWDSDWELRDDCWIWCEEIK
jgi:hypothetical protein